MDTVRQDKSVVAREVAEVRHQPTLLVAGSRSQSRFLQAQATTVMKLRQRHSHEVCSEHTAVSSITHTHTHAPFSQLARREAGFQKELLRAAERERQLQDEIRCAPCYWLGEARRSRCSGDFATWPAKLKRM